MKGLPKMVVGSLTRSNKLIALKQLLFFGLLSFHSCEDIFYIHWFWMGEKMKDEVFWSFANNYPLHYP